MSTHKPASGNEFPSIPLSITGLLAGIIILQCSIQAWIIYNAPSNVNAFFFRQGFEDSTLRVLDLALVWTLLLSPLGMFTKKTRWSLILPTLIFLALSVFKVANADGGPLYDRFAPGAQAIRIFMPLALLLLCRPEKTAHQVAFMGIRVCTALTFITHGVECLMSHPAFIDLIIGSGQRILGIMITESQALLAMRIIGIMDIVTASLLLGRRWRAIALWMAFWAALAACSRMFSGSVDVNWYKTLLRVANAGGPLILFMWWTVLKKTPRDS